MSNRLKSGFWNPTFGIRFSPKQTTRSLPSLPDVSRPFSLFNRSNSKPDQLEPSLYGTSSSREEIPKSSHNDTSSWVKAGVNTSLASPRTNTNSTPDEDETSPKEATALEEHLGNASARDKFPPSTSLRYQMPPETFQRVKKSPSGSTESFWSHTLYQCTGEDGSPRKVKVHYCTSKHTMEHVCKTYFLGEKVIGFDLEWSPWATGNSGPRKNVALIQIASESRIGLFHCSIFSKDDFVAPTFRKIMGDPNVYKVGVAIKADCTRLKKFLGVETLGIYELSNLYKVVRYSRERRPSLVNKSLVPLASLVESCLGLPLYKGDSVRSSDWTKHLSGPQISYSASDAYAGLQLYYALEEQRRNLVPVPPHPRAAELGLPLQVAITEDDDALLDSETSGQNDAKDIKPETTLVLNQQTRDNRIVAADLKTQQYRTSKKTGVSVAPSQLRAYYIWYDEHLNPESIAKLLRDPPLQTHTVVSYILNAVVAESLPYNKTRMKEEVLSLLQPNALAAARYTDLVKACMISSTGE